MLTLPDAILPVLHPFATLFRSPTWLKAQILLVGAILAPGQRTVAAALRVMGLSDDRNYARYHQVLNRAVWSPRQAAGILLVLLLQHLDRCNSPSCPPQLCWPSSSLIQLMPTQRLSCVVRHVCVGVGYTAPGNSSSLWCRCGAGWRWAPGYEEPGVRLGRGPRGVTLRVSHRR